jgi:tetratricopeptide (TPR) repeat protein
MNKPENMTLQATLESRTPAAETASIRDKLEWPGRICILLAVVVTPWLFGGVYFSAQFLMALCCMAGIGLLWFESGVSERRSLVLPFLMIPLLLGISLALFQMVPLGEAFGWLLGKQKEFYPLFTGDPLATPSISMSRSDTWNQVGLLVVAFSALSLGCRYFRSNAHAKILLIVLTVLGVAIALFGLIQALTDDKRRFIYWTVELVGGGTPFGPYVNRNNAAGLLLICFGASLGLIATTFERERRGPKPLGTKDLPFWTQFKNHSLRFIAELNAPRIAALLAPMVIATGIIGSLSRGGTLSLLVAGITTLFLYGMARRPSFSAFIFIPAFLLAILIAFWLGFGDQLMNRMEDINTVDVTSQSDYRIQHWKDTWPATKEFGLLGSGVGAYDEVHRIYNRGRTQVVFTYAENQFYQALVELGWPGLALVLASWGIMLYCSLTLLFRGSSALNVGIGVAGLFTTVGVSLASFFDFGLYIPANMLMMSLFCGFVAYHAQSLSSRLKKKGWLYHETPNWIAQILFLVTFAALSMFALDFWRKWQIQSVARGDYPYRTFSLDNPDLEKTDEMIADLEPMVATTRSREGIDYLGRLWIHRSRLQLLDILESGNTTEDRNQLWQRTSLDMVQENIWALHDDGAVFSADKFSQREFIKDNLPSAYKYLLVSRRLDPMDAQTHLMLGQINAIHRRTSTASQDMERAILLAPNKVDFKYLTGFYYLQVGNSKKAAGHLRDLLENDPKQFDRVMKLIFGGSQRNVAAIDEMTVARDIMPDDPYLLYQVAKKYLTLPAARSLALNRADKLLTDITPDDRKLMISWAEVKFEKQEYAECIKIYESYLFSRPQDHTIHYRVAQIHLMLGDFDTAEEKLSRILRMTDSANLKAKAEKLLEQVWEKRKTNGDSENR